MTFPYVEIVKFVVIVPDKDVESPIGLRTALKNWL
jgi:hypothetical protein